jgi:cytochrome P450
MIHHAIGRALRSCAGLLPGRNEALGPDTAPFRPARHHILMVFSGGGGIWREAGRTLYQREAAFRGSIDEADTLVRSLAGFSPSAAYRGEWVPQSWEERCQEHTINEGLLALGAFDLLEAAGAVPTAVAGISLGETAAAYASGVITRPEAIRIICSLAMNLGHENRQCVQFFLELPTPIALSLCRSAPAPLDFVGVTSPGVATLVAAAADAPCVRPFLESTGALTGEFASNGWYHVPAVPFDRAQFARDTACVRPRSPRVPIYSAARGGLVETGEFDARYWSRSAECAYYFGDAIACALSGGCDVVIPVGHPMIIDWMIRTARDAGRPVHMIDWIGGEGRLPTDLPPPVKVRAPPLRGVPDQPARSLEEAPAVCWSEAEQLWSVTGYAELLSALSQPALFSNAPYKDVDEVLLAADPPRHAAARRTLTRLFTATATECFADEAERLSRALLKRELDVVGDYGVPFSQGVAAAILGLAPGDLDAIRVACAVAWASASPAAVPAALVAAAPRSSLYRRLLDEGTSEEAARSLFSLLWQASVETTERLIANATLALLRHRQAAAAVRAEPRLLGAFIEETMRLYPPASSIRRMTSSPTILGGIELPAGAAVRLSIAAANRDPAAFPDPAAFRLNRPPPRHLAFGSGIHHCMAAPLARRIVPIALAPMVAAGTELRALQPTEGLLLADREGAPLSRLLVALAEP